MPAGSEASFHILALDATGLGNAWAIAEAAPGAGPLVRAARSGPRTGSGPLWVERRLGAAAFADRDTPGEGISGLAPARRRRRSR